MREPTVKVAFDNRRGIQVNEIPAHVAMNLGQALMEAVRRDFQDPAVQEDFRRWKAERAAREARA